MIKRFIAAFQLWIGIDHFFEAERIAKYTTFLAESSLGNTFLFLTALRITLLSDSMAFVV